MWGLTNLYIKKLRTVVGTYKAPHSNIGFGTPSDFQGYQTAVHVKDNDSRRNTDTVYEVPTYMKVRNVGRTGTQGIINSSFVVLCLVWWCSCLWNHLRKKKKRRPKNKLFHLDKITKAEITEGSHDNTFNLASIRKTVNTLIATKWNRPINFPHAETGNHTFICQNYALHIAYFHNCQQLYSA